MTAASSVESLVRERHWNVDSLRSAYRLLSKLVHESNESWPRFVALCGREVMWAQSRLRPGPLIDVLKALGARVESWADVLDAVQKVDDEVMIRSGCLSPLSVSAADGAGVRRRGGGSGRARARCCPRSSTQLMAPQTIEEPVTACPGDGCTPPPEDTAAACTATAPMEDTASSPMKMFPCAEAVAPSTGGALTFMLQAAEWQRQQAMLQQQFQAQQLFPLYGAQQQLPPLPQFQAQYLPLQPEYCPPAKRQRI